MYVKEQKDKEEAPPALYNYHTDSETIVYCDSPNVMLPDEEFLNEDSDEFVDLFDEFNSAKLN